MIKGFAGEVLKETQEAGFNPIVGLKKAIDARRRAKEYRIYGTPEDSQAAYAFTKDSFARFFENNADRVGQKPGDTEVSQISFDWRGMGHGAIDKIGENYRMHITTSPYDFGNSVWGERWRRKNTLIEVNDEGAIATEWVTTSVQPPIDRAMPFVSESKAKVVPLTAQEALDLAHIVHTEYVTPNFNSLPIDQDPGFQAYLKGKGLGGDS